MKKNYFTLADLAAEGKKIAKLTSNRNLNEKAVKAKMKSLKEYGQLVPAIVVESKLCDEQGMGCVDFETGETVTDFENYLVILDGQHRYEAYLRLINEDKDFGRSFHMMNSLQPAVAVSKALAEINTCTNPWKGSDLLIGAAMMIESDLPLLDEMADLARQGYSQEAASKWLTFKKIGNPVYVKAINGTIDDCLKNTAGVERGKKLLNAARQSFKEEFLKTRNLPDWIISKYEAATDEDKAEEINKLINFLANISRVDAEAIEKAKGKRGGDTKGTVINNTLNRLYEG